MISDRIYYEVDIDALSTVLAENAWKEETASVNLSDLYENGKDGLVKDEWARVFFDLKEAYLYLIEYFKKPDNGTMQEGRNSEGEFYFHQN